MPIPEGYFPEGPPEHMGGPSTDKFDELMAELDGVEEGNLEKQLDVLSRITECLPHAFHLLLAEAVTAFNLYKTTKSDHVLNIAHEAVLDVLDLDPQCHEAKLILGEIWLVKGNNNDSVEMLKSCVDYFTEMAQRATKSLKKAKSARSHPRPSQRTLDWSDYYNRYTVGDVPASAYGGYPDFAYNDTAAEELYNAINAEVDAEILAEIGNSAADSGSTAAETMSDEDFSSMLNDMLDDLDTSAPQQTSGQMPANRPQPTATPQFGSDVYPEVTLQQFPIPPIPAVAAPLFQVPVSSYPPYFQFPPTVSGSVLSTQVNTT